MKKTNTNKLLEQMKSVAKNQHRESPKPDPEIAIAWLKGEVSQSQIGKILWPDRNGNTTSYTYAFLIRSLRDVYSQGKIRIVE